MKIRKSVVVPLAVGALALAGASCSPPEEESDSTSSAAKATSAKDLGGMEALVKAAEKEGELNVIALPPTWANYGNVIKGFAAKYDIKVNSAQPDAASQDEINAAKSLKGTKRAPDVFDLGQSVALANTEAVLAVHRRDVRHHPRRVQGPEGQWVNDYGGYMSIGYDSSKVPDVKNINDLLGTEYKGKVALNGDPTQAGAAFSAVVMASVANGGSADDVAPGVEFFQKLKEAGNFLPVDPTPATIESGQTPVVIDWDYTNAAETAKVKTWKVVVPEGAAVGGYYYQAINKDAPHPAAARLWQEYLFSDEGQNLYLAGGARPVRADDMDEAGSINADDFAKLPKVSGTPVLLTTEQTTKAADYLSKNWSKVTG